MERILISLMALLVAVATPLESAMADASDGRMEIRELEENVWLHVTYRELEGIGWYPSNGLIVAREGQAWLIDTTWPEEDMPALLEWMAEQGLELQGSLSTHFHADRASGIAFLNQRGVRTLASEDTNRLLEEHGQPLASTPIPLASFDWVPGLITVFDPGPGHTRDNVVAWLPGYRILVGGCLIKGAEARGMGNTADADLAAWPDSVKKVREKFPDPVMVIPGHGEPGGPELLEHTLGLLKAAQ